MNSFWAFVLAAAGLAVLIWNKSISTRWRVFHTNQLNRGYSRLAHFFGWDNPDRPFAVFLFRLLTILLGLKSDEFSFVFLRGLRFGDGRRPIAL
jgi:hypothetical protein